ncbi:MAG: sialidase family protein [Christensenellales bacterium]|jgi:hypothetical protein
MNFTVIPNEIPNDGMLFVDHSLKKRSGHMSHALVEYRPGCVLAFYSNCSGTRNPYFPGHNGFGWIEYKRSFDYGTTWSQPIVLGYSMDSFINQPFTISCEKAVSPSENTIVLFCTRNENPNGWEPYLEPVVLRSEDGGETWSDAGLLCQEKGRVYDALVHEGKIYALQLACSGFLTDSVDQRYILYVSVDEGRSFEKHSELPGEYLNHAYGNIIVRPDGAFIAYTYNQDDEYNMDYYISYDGGKTWPEQGKSYCTKRIRNPQVARVRGGYILHGRSGCVDRALPMDLVLYAGDDGIHWDEGRMLCSRGRETAYYSNNLVMEMPDGSQRVLIQSSVPYEGARVNICHWFLTFDKDKGGSQ